MVCLFFGFAGCTYHYDVSRLKPFSMYSGHEVTLVRPACLTEVWREPGGGLLLFNLNPDQTYSGQFMFEKRRTPADTVVKNAGYGGQPMYLTPAGLIKDYERVYWLWDKNMDKCGLTFVSYWGEKAIGTNTARFWTIPAGSKLFIDQVNVDGNTFAGSYTCAKGRLYLNDYHKEITFHYSWAAGFNLPRAPWEDETIPEQRYIGPKGNEYSNAKQ